MIMLPALLILAPDARLRPIWLALYFLLPSSLALAQPAAPYLPDLDTVCLFHFDHPAGASIATNAGSLDRNAYAIQNSTSGNGLATPPLVTTMFGAAGYTN